MPRLDDPSYFLCPFLVFNYFVRRKKKNLPCFLFCPVQAKPDLLIGSVPLLKTKLDNFFLSETFFADDELH